MKGINNIESIKEFRTTKARPIQEILTSEVLLSMSINAEEKIGWNSGRLWNLLNEKGIKSIKEVVRQLKLSEQGVCLSIGWLAREGKLNFEERNNEIFLSLK